jgi:hypothetical protein
MYCILNCYAICQVCNCEADVVDVGVVMVWMLYATSDYCRNIGDREEERNRRNTVDRLSGPNHCNQPKEEKKNKSEMGMQT